LVKTFCGWGEQQFTAGTLILTSPAGHSYVTTPGSTLLFPSLCRPTGAISAPDADPPPDGRGERTAMMPKRRRTRAQDRAHRIATERRQNRMAREARRKDCEPWHFGPGDAVGDGEPPPF
jgi:hypothetical protein